MAMYRLGCCSSGSAFGAADDAGLDPDTLALLNRTRAAQAAEAGGGSLAAGVTTVDSPTDPPASAPFPWGKLLAVSVGAGLILHHVTRRRR